MGRTMRGLAAGLLVGLVATASAAPEATAPRSRMVTPELAAQWWQWASYLPADSNPVSDTTGALCAMGQRGNVWFLAGGFGDSKIRRSCAVPVGHTLFFPIINMVYWPRRAGSTTCESVRQAAALNNDTLLELFAELDGRPLPKTARQRVATIDCFDIFARVPAGRRPDSGSPAATDGYWMWLDPLPPGRHVLKFGGRYNRESGAYGRMVQDIEYELLVE